MIAHGLRFHHLGIAVRNPDKATDFLISLGYSLHASKFDPLQRVNVQMGTHRDMPDVEMIWPGKESSPIDVLLGRFDAGVYHNCYATDSIEATLDSLADSKTRYRVVVEPTPACLFDDDPVAFIQIPGFGLIELLEQHEVRSHEPVKRTSDEHRAIARSSIDKD